ncbi:fumarylacetoacetate hydrolase family protein [Paucibacter sediminis]|uniref:Fumarylacetoacetate hydrolase family protein n=1 Tax=Paucibacter sediminis TaxID=3019553 RepID=A0AA95NFZ5_9BURK|nr:fumarylacetoacetate hydrolase family protein [Paucibacter sp. S2-9]WIT13554.1 fumarylacetoacetate hydrolase family protein [Paucibacter sp. S2-9]
MSDYIFPPAPQPSVAVHGSEARYAVARIFCVGRNYAAHAREMGGNPDREPPFYFTKPASALVASGATIAYPPGTKNYHYEMELVIAIGAPVFKVTPEVARAAVWGYAAGLDMTRRDLQAEAKAAGRPWDTAKGFEQSAVITPLTRASRLGELKSGAITLAVNGTEKQRGDLADMIWSVPEIVANLSQYYHLQPGDLIYTGTPEGVGAVKPGDVISGEIAGLDRLSLTIADPE